MEKQTRISKRGKVSTYYLVKVSILVALAYLLSFVRIPLPIFPEYLKLDIAELPALIGGFALGPVAGVAVVFIRNLIEAMTKSTTGGIGNISNFVVGGTFVFVSSMIYHRKKSKKTAALGLISGTLIMSVIAIFSNKYLIFPLYGLPVDWGVLLTFILPFNLLKGGINSLIALLLYKKISGLLKREQIL